MALVQRTLIELSRAQPLTGIVRDSNKLLARNPTLVPNVASAYAIKNHLSCQNYQQTRHLRYPRNFVHTNRNVLCKEGFGALKVFSDNSPLHLITYV